MKSSLFRFVLMALVFLGALGVYGWWYSVVEKESTHVAEVAAAIETKTVTQSRAAAIRSTLDELKNDESQIRKYFISTDDVAAFIENLQKKSAVADAKINVQSVSTVMVSGHSAVQATLTIEGSFSGVIRTLGRIEYAPYDLSVTALALNASSASLGNNAATGKRWNALMTIVVGTASSSAVTATPKQTASTTLPTPHL